MAPVQKKPMSNRVKVTTDRSTALQIMIQVKSELNLEEIIKAGNFSNYAKLLRVMAFVLRFIVNCKASSIQGTTRSFQIHLSLQNFVKQRIFGVEKFRRA